MSATEFSHEEEVLGKAYDHRLMARILGYLRPYKSLVVAGVVLSALTSILAVIPALLTKWIIDGPVLTGDFGWLVQLCLVYLGVLVVTFAAGYFNMYLLTQLGQRVVRDLRLQLFKHLQLQRSGYFDRMPVGRLMTRITSDINAINDLVTSGLVTIVQDVFMLIALTVTLFWIDWKLAAWVFTVMPFMVGAILFFSVMMRRSYREMRLRLSRLNASLQENISGMRVVQAFRREKVNADEFGGLSNRLREAHVNTILWFAFLFPVVDFLAWLGTAIILWHAGRVDPVIEGVSVGTMVFFILQLDRFFAPIRDLAEKYNTMQAAMAASERIFLVLDAQERIHDPSLPSVPATTEPFFPKASVETPKPTFERALRLENVYFAYQDENWVLKDVSLEFRPGQSTALVGPTGSGKTTITALLMRMYEFQKGRITLDGRDIREFALRDLRALFAVVLQDVTLFTGTIRDNLKLSRDLTDPQLWEIAKRVNADGFIKSFDLGMDHPVRERGATFSAGERQLLSFARALAFDPRILILDEATSNIDTETERLIQEATDHLVADRTAIIIAHRLSTIQRADNIVVMHHGHVAEQGTHQELLAQAGLYKKLYELQAGGGADADTGDDEDDEGAGILPANATLQKSE